MPRTTLTDRLTLIINDDPYPREEYKGEPFDLSPWVFIFREVIVRFTCEVRWRVSFRLFYRLLYDFSRLCPSGLDGEDALNVIQEAFTDIAE
ncbi:hypothetical protein A5690_18905 [Mycobacterium intracellulare]|nr:hypothetical protein A5690_18905 [Mycobacterium intracellulare]